MCMFTNPSKAVIKKPQWAWKIFHMSFNWNSHKPKLAFRYVNRFPQRGKWLSAKGAYGRPVSEYGFHVYDTKTAAIKHFKHAGGKLVKVAIFGKVYGEGQGIYGGNGKRVRFLFIPEHGNASVLPKPPTKR